MKRIVCFALFLAAANLSAVLAGEKASAEFYGYIKLDGSYDGHSSSVGDYMKWVNSGNGTPSQFNLTGNQTRFGVQLKSPDMGKIEVSGQIEADLYGFQGGVGQENKPYAMFRQFYAKANWAEIDLSLLAGQTADVISPLNADTVNYSVLWWAGNTGYRRPQLRLTKGFGLGEKGKFKLEVAAVRVMGHDAEAGSNSNTVASTSGSGNDSRFPGFQGRASLSMPLLTSTAAELGFGIYFGKERYNGGSSLTQNLYVADLFFPIIQGLNLKGEYYWGKNTDSYNGGIGQGLLAASLTGVKATGAWAQLGYTGLEDWAFNAGFGMDTADEDVLADASKTKNVSYFGNLSYFLTKAFQTSFEVSEWRTTYKNVDTFNNTRYQLAFIYKF
jgi:hypothetical protein